MTIDKLGALGAPSPELPATITPQELGVILDLAVNANAPVGRALQMGDLFKRAARLANAKNPIGEIVLPPRLTQDLFVEDGVESLRKQYAAPPCVPPRDALYEPDVLLAE